jgi:tRNA nucleotidyltransferase (CCA-adding enzyme)
MTTLLSLDGVIMTEKKKREKVVAEITAAHLAHFASDVGTPMTQEEAIAFLNRDGRAYAMWKHMMQAGEDYIRTMVQRERTAILRMQASPTARNRAVV